MESHIINCRSLRLISNLIRFRVCVLFCAELIETDHHQGGNEQSTLL